MRVADGDRWVKGLMVPLFTTPLRLSIVVFSMMLHETYSRKSPSRGSSGLHWHGAIDGPNAAMSSRAMRTCSYIYSDEYDRLANAKESLVGKTSNRQLQDVLSVPSMLSKKGLKGAAGG